MTGVSLSRIAARELPGFNKEETLRLGYAIEYSTSKSVNRMTIYLSGERTQMLHVCLWDASGRARVFPFIDESDSKMYIWNAVTDEDAASRVHRPPGFSAEEVGRRWPMLTSSRGKKVTGQMGQQRPWQEGRPVTRNSMRPEKRPIYMLSFSINIARARLDRPTARRSNPG